MDRDGNLDVTKTFLVISMVFTHAFQCYLLGDYNRHFTYYVTVGFIFISGYMYSAVYAERMLNEPCVMPSMVFIDILPLDLSGLL